jgi:hypothetical protein
VQNWNNIPILIPSKGRAGKTKTNKLLETCGMEYAFVVEPQEKEQYQNYNYFVLPENNKGITYCRNWILNEMRKQGNKFFWMLDDDIKEFGETLGGKCIKKDATILNKAFSQLTRFEASIYSLELRQFAWSQKDLVKNRIAMQCVLFNLSKMNFDYDLSIKIREDYDLTFQAITKSFGTLKTSKYYYNIEPMKSQSGGMSEWYYPEYEKEQVELLCKKWPRLLTPITKNNRFDVKINWKVFK